MAHYAFINQDHIVVKVITGVDENIIQTDSNSTQIGGTSKSWEQFYASLPWFQGLTCKRTSYNNNIRKQYAGIGYSYDPILDVFITPKPYPSWLLDQNFDWQAPTLMPDGEYTWNENTLSWIEIEA